MELHGTAVVAFALLNPAAPGSIPGILEFFSEMIFQEKIVDTAKVNWRLCGIEQLTAEACKRQLNPSITASVKPGLQKKFSTWWSDSFTSGWSQKFGRQFGSRKTGLLEENGRVCRGCRRSVKVLRRCRATLARGSTFDNRRRRRRRGPDEPSRRSAPRCCRRDRGRRWKWISTTRRCVVRQGTKCRMSSTATSTSKSMRSTGLLRTTMILVSSSQTNFLLQRIIYFSNLLSQIKYTRSFLVAPLLPSNFM